MDRAAGQHAECDAERRPRLFRDTEDRRAFGDEGHARARANAEIDRAGGKSLLQLGVPGESRNFDVEPVFFEDAFLHADIDRRELEERGEALAEAQRLTGVRRHASREHAPCDKHGRCDGAAADQSGQTHHPSLHPAQRHP